MLRQVLIAMLAPLALLACSAEEEAPPPAPTDNVTPALERLAARAEPGILGAHILDLRTGQAWGVNADKPLPMQSVFKLPLAILVLHQVDRGALSLDEEVTLTRDQLSLAHSPIADRFDEKQTYTVGELVRAAVATSDNTAADVLMARTGGPQALTAFFQERGIENFRVDRYEFQLQPQAVGLPEFTGQWIGSDAFAEAQEQVPLESQKAAMTLYLADPRDRISAAAATQILAMLESGKLLSEQSTDLLMEILRATSTGADRLKAGIPANAILYHKTGTGPDVDTINSATNDIGIIEFAGGRRLAVAVLLAGSQLPRGERADLIAEVARIASATVAPPANVP